MKNIESPNVYKKADPLKTSNKTIEDKSLSPEQEIMMLKFEALILEAEKINEGAEGVIALIDLQKADQKLRKFLVGEAEVPERSALKLLKVYQSGRGQKEFQMQLDAHNLLAKNKDAAQAPRPYVYRNMNIRSEAVQKILEGKFGIDGSGGQVELFIMDYIEGDDLATAMYREVIRRDTRKMVHLKDKVNGMKFDELQRRVQESLKFDTPGGKGKSQNEKEFEKQKVFELNAQLLYKDLREKGFLISSEVRKKVKKGLEILHKNDMYHRDLHSRNIMLGKDGSVFIIDFGKSISLKGKPSGESIYTIDEERSYIEDGEILDLLQRLEGDAWKSLPSQFEVEISENAIDENTGYQLGRLREILEERELELTETILQNFINNTLAATKESNRAENEIVALLNISTWDDVTNKVVISYMGKKAKDKSTPDNLKKLFKKVLQKLKDA